MEIGTTDITLEKLLSGSDTLYEVPPYQRDYAWKEDEIEELWNDVVRLLDHDEQYFMGSIVLNQEDHTQDQFYIVDGQQRLATFSILFSVIRAWARGFAEGDMMPAVPRNGETTMKARKLAEMAEDRLFYRTEPDHYFVTLNKKDQQTFRRVLEQWEPLISDEDLKVVSNESRVIKAHKYLSRYVREQFNEGSEGLEDLYRFFLYIDKRLVFLKITVSDDYDAFVLFESLNSKGLNLSTTDLLKNKLLMSCRENAELKDRVLEGWDDSIKLLEPSRFGPVDFLRHYWGAFHSDVTSKELYKVLKRKIDSGDLDVEEFTIDLYDKAETYARITADTLVWPSTELQRDTLEWYLAQIHTLGYSLCLPSILYALSKRQAIASELSRRSLVYLFRYITVGEGAVRVAKQTFRSVLEDLRADKSDEEILGHLVAVQQYGLDDDSFRRGFANLRVRDGRVAKYVVTALHLRETNYEQIPNHLEVHLEHVLPQKPERWMEEGFDVGDRRVEDWVYSIGNMTLLNKRANQAITNKPFGQKVNEYRPRTEGDPDGSSFPMTNRIHAGHQEGEEAWTASTITERAGMFADPAVEIWSLG